MTPNHEYTREAEALLRDLANEHAHLASARAFLERDRERMAGLEQRVERAIELMRGLMRTPGNEAWQTMRLAIEALQGKEGGE